MRHLLWAFLILGTGIAQLGHPRQVPLPGARACHSAASHHSGIVVWGGSAECGVGVLNDSTLWSWDGTRWRAHQGPPIVPREDALLVYRPEDSSLVLIGGRREGVVHDDIWHFAANSWRQVRAVGGPGRIEHGAAAYDARRKRVVVFGGAVGRSLSSRTYEWDGARWHEFDVPGPAARVGHGMSWSAADGAVLLYGGFSSAQFRDLWKWDGARWERLSDSGPSLTEGHVVTESDRGVAIVGPGLGASSRVGVWRWHGGRFDVGGAVGPSVRVGATATYDSRRRVLVYLGGAAGSGSSLAINEFDGARWR